MILTDRQTDVGCKVDTTAQAERVPPYDSLGRYRGQRYTYAYSDLNKRALGATALNYGILQGCENRIVRLQRMVVCGTHGTSANYVDFGIRKYKDAWAATFTTLSQLRAVAHDSLAPEAGALVLYTTAGVTITQLPFSYAWASATIVSENRYQPITATVNAPPAKYDFDCRFKDENEMPTLRGPREFLGFGFMTAPTQIFTGTFNITWSEEIL